MYWGHCALKFLRLGVLVRINFFGSWGILLLSSRGCRLSIQVLCSLCFYSHVHVGVRQLLLSLFRSEMQKGWRLRSAIHKSLVVWALTSISKILGNYSALKNTFPFECFLSAFVAYQCHSAALSTLIFPAWSQLSYLSYLASQTSRIYVLQDSGMSLNGVYL